MNFVVGPLENSTRLFIFTGHRRVGANNDWENFCFPKNFAAAAATAATVVSALASSLPAVRVRAHTSRPGVSCLCSASGSTGAGSGPTDCYGIGTDTTTLGSTAG